MQIRSLSVLWFVVSLVGVALFSTDGFTEEKLDRGLIALERSDGSVYVAWRLLRSDPSDIAFEIFRKGPNDKDFHPRAKQSKPIVRSTNVVDRGVEREKTYSYRLVDLSEGKECGSVDISVTGKPLGYIRIPFQGSYAAQKVGIGDLDGDGTYEYVIKQPDFNTDPYQQPGYWKKSTMTYKLEAYRADGTFMWRYDMGWSIEAGIWYSPWIVYDVDQDGKAEIYTKAGEGDPREPTGHVTSGPEYLVKIDGETGKVLARTPWLSREGYQDYNRYCRNFLTVAYLDGQNPSLIMQRGTYRLIKTMALDKNFEKIWYWDATEKNPKYRGQGSHGLVTADVDRDGRDELVIGAAVIDDNGKGLWTLGMGHPDVCYVADIDPDNEGLEVFYGFETRQDTDGICVVDAKTGKKLWAHKKPTRHIHAQGMAADVLAEHLGMEVFSGERDYPERWFYSAKGDLIKIVERGTLTPRAVWWDDDPQKEVLIEGAIRDWGGKPLQPVQGRVIGIADCLGDAREELITSLEGELRIYTTTIPATTRRTCLMQDRQYRLGVVAQTMGYYYPAQLGEY